MQLSGGHAASAAGRRTRIISLPPPAKFGKDEGRVRELLLRGTLVSGASRFRWAGWEADPQALLDLLATFPDPEPARPFTPDRCVRAILRGPLGRYLRHLERIVDSPAPHTVRSRSCLRSPGAQAAPGAGYRSMT